MGYIKIASLVLLTVACLLGACKNDEVDIESTIKGRWELEEAYRNGNATETLAGLYMDFKANGKMQTNITPEEETLTYEIKDKQILQRGGSLNAAFDIESINDSTLIVSTTIQEIPFRLRFSK